MADMTLEQVRNICKHRAQQYGHWAIQKQYEQMADAIDAAIKQRERDAKDTARLDWLEAHPRLAAIVIDGNATDCYLYGVSGAMGLKLREILDAAMAKESGNG